MIPRSDLVVWSDQVGWPSIDQVEQDLVLSRLIVEIAQDPYVGDELVFRGGTCLHKLYDTGSGRYSEDLDYVRRSDGGIGDLTRAVSAIGERSHEVGDLGLLIQPGEVLGAFEAQKPGHPSPEA